MMFHRMPHNHSKNQCDENMYSYRTLALPPTEVGGEAFSLAPSDEGATR